jgi:hypothetical protein
LKPTQINVIILHVRGSKELTLLKSPYYPEQYTNPIQYNLYQNLNGVLYKKKKKKEIHTEIQKIRNAKTILKQK